MEVDTEFKKIKKDEKMKNTYISPFFSLDAKII